MSMKRIIPILITLLFAVGMSSCSIFKKCDCPKFNYLEEGLTPIEEEIVAIEVEDTCNDSDENFGVE